MHIFDALKKDHDKMKDLLAVLLALGDDDDREARADLIQEIRDELIPHARAEEALLYNSMRVLETGKDVVRHGYKEHMEAEALLRALQVEDTVHMGWKATAQKLKDALEHHMEEEETEIFAAAGQLFTQAEATELGELFEQLKPQVRDEGFMKNSFDMVANMLPPRFTAALRGDSAPQNTKQKPADSHQAS